MLHPSLYSAPHPEWMASRDGAASRRAHLEHFLLVLLLLRNERKRGLDGGHRRVVFDVLRHVELDELVPVLLVEVDRLVEAGHRVRDEARDPDAAQPEPEREAEQEGSP